MELLVLGLGLGAACLVAAALRGPSRRRQQRPPALRPAAPKYGTSGPPRRRPPVIRPAAPKYCKPASPRQSAPRKVRPAPPAYGPLPPIPASRELKGRAWVIDGDTIKVCKTKIRLAGIDAPELDQPWGQKSKSAMIALCNGQTITVRLTGERSHTRLVGTCYLPDGRDLGAELVRQGLALDWGRFSGGKYRHLEPDGVRRRIQAWRSYARRERETEALEAHRGPLPGA